MHLNTDVSFSILVSEPVPVGVPKNYGHSPNNADSAESFNEGNVALLNNCEEPVSLELQPAPVVTQVSVIHIMYSTQIISPHL